MFFVSKKTVEIPRDLIIKMAASWTPNSIEHSTLPTGGGRWFSHRRLQILDKGFKGHYSQLRDRIERQAYLLQECQHCQDCRVCEGFTSAH